MVTVNVPVALGGLVALANWLAPKIGGCLALFVYQINWAIPR